MSESTGAPVTDADAAIARGDILAVAEMLTWDEWFTATDRDGTVVHVGLKGVTSLVVMAPGNGDPTQYRLHAHPDTDTAHTCHVVLVMATSAIPGVIVGPGAMPSAPDVIGSFDMAPPAIL